jgi:hypothetical protein
VAELLTPHRVRAEREDVVAPNCERVTVIGSGVSFFEFLESVPQSFFEGLPRAASWNLLGMGTNPAAEGGPRVIRCPFSGLPSGILRYSPKCVVLLR